VAYKSVLQNYPESANSDYYQFMIVRSLYNYADQSIREKQEERFANVVSAYSELKQNYPNSKYVAEGEKYFNQANDNLNKLRNEHQ